MSKEWKKVYSLVSDEADREKMTEQLGAARQAIHSRLLTLPYGGDHDERDELEAALRNLTMLEFRSEPDSAEDQVSDKHQSDEQ